MKKLVSLLVIIVMVVQVQTLFAQTAAIVPVERTDDWVLLGTHVVDYTMDRDVISFKEKSGKFAALKFVVKDGTINMHKCTVHFAGGETKDIPFAEEVNSANDGKMLDLKGSNLAIEKVTFWYDTKNSSDKKSVVEVWGKS